MRRWESIVNLLVYVWHCVHRDLERLLSRLTCPRTATTRGQRCQASDNFIPPV